MVQVLLQFVLYTGAVSEWRVDVLYGKHYHNSVQRTFYSGHLRDCKLTSRAESEWKRENCTNNSFYDCQ